MCLAYPGRIVGIDGSIAKVDFGGVVKEVNIAMVDAEVGKYVIVHAGFAIQVLDEEEARGLIEQWSEILEVMGG